jgi:hypothetical protein
LAHGVLVGCVDGLNGRDGLKLIFNQVECLMGLAIFLHQQEAQSGKDLAITVSIHDSFLNEVGNGVIGIDVAADCISDTDGGVKERIAIGGDREEDENKAGWGEATRTSTRAVLGGEQGKQATRTGSDGSLRGGCCKLSHAGS